MAHGHENTVSSTLIISESIFSESKVTNNSKSQNITFFAELSTDGLPKHGDMLSIHLI